jgi:hypothetical protein
MRIRTIPVGFDFRAKNSVYQTPGMLRGSCLRNPWILMASGQKYLKAIYREYTDATFETIKPRPPQWEHLGILDFMVIAGRFPRINPLMV